MKFSFTGLAIAVLLSHCKSSSDTDSQTNEVFVSDNVKLEVIVDTGAPLFREIAVKVTNKGRDTIDCKMATEANIYHSGNVRLGQAHFSHAIDGLKPDETRMIPSTSSVDALTDLGIPGVTYVSSHGGDSEKKLEPFDVFFDCKDSKKGRPIAASIQFISNLFKKKEVMHEERSGINVNGLDVIMTTDLPGQSLYMKVTNRNKKTLSCTAQIKYDVKLANGSGQYLGSGNLYHGFEGIAPNQSQNLPAEFGRDKLVELGVPGAAFVAESLSKQLTCK